MMKKPESSSFFLGSPITLVVTVIVAVVLFTLLAQASGKKRRGSTEVPQKRRPITMNEQAMYNRLVQALPDMIVLAQVSFSALLTARSWAARNTFNRKMADFVVCDRAFNVIAVVELDDASHRGREASDGQRDDILKGAGYRVLRYPRVPDVDRVQRDFKPPPLPPESGARIEPSLSS